MLLNFMDYVEECAQNILDEKLAGDEAVAEVGYYLDYHADEVIASYVMHYGIHTVNEIGEIYEFFENKVLEEVVEIEADQCDFFFFHV